MRGFNILLTFLIAANVLYSQEELGEVALPIYGETFLPKKIYNEQDMLGKYKNLKVGDSVQITFSARPNAVCKAKGCWLQLRLDDQSQVLVKFKDYGFFVPTDLKNEEVVVNGKAFIEELSVEEQRHFAKDAGKTNQEIAKITQPKRTLRFEATGVLIQE